MTETKPLMQGKRGLIMGVANDRSIAWGIATLSAHGAELAFTYQAEVLERRVKPLAESPGPTLLMQCDVTDDESLDQTFAELKKSWNSLDFIVHAIAFSDKNELTGKYRYQPLEFRFDDGRVLLLVYSGRATGGRYDDGWGQYGDPDLLRC